jgi:CDP-diacylglycerol--serine O-phosphatidyltransferase
MQIRIFTIPNIITLLNLLSGCIAIILAFHGDLISASLLIFLAGIFDFFDGLAARLLKSYSELGKQLDSLADVVSFGVAPSLILYGLYVKGYTISNPDFTFIGSGLLHQSIIISSFIIALFSALRLAKFNIDERQSDSFIGVPTPINGFVIASLPFIIKQFPLLKDIILAPYFLLPLSILLSLLLISEIPLISLKFKNLKFEGNQKRFIFMGLSVLLLVFFQIAAFPLIFVIYLLVSFNFKKTIN